MSQQNATNLPPPPPRAPTAHHAQQRRPVSMIVQPPSITTNIARTLAVQAPLSAHTLAPPHPYSPVTPSALNPQSAGGLTPVSGVSQRAMEPYNPRQWSGRGQVSGSQMVFAGRSSTRESTGHEGDLFGEVTVVFVADQAVVAVMPSPPPPYTPDAPHHNARGSRVMPLLDTGSFIASPVPGTTSATPSPAVPMSPAFPPPPSQSGRHRDRSASGIANARGFLAGLRGKSTASVEIPPGTTIHAPEIAEPQPPAARRAASTGHIQSSSAASSALGSGDAGRGSPDNSWQPGMPLPGPPPGPPPPTLRSQSLNRYPPTSRSNSQSSEHSLDVPQPRRKPAGSSLGPIPPTPADWNETDPLPHNFEASPRTSTPEYQPLRIDTGSNRDSLLMRRPARRDGSAQGIRERRSRSKAMDRNSRLLSPMSDDDRPFDPLSATSEGAISRRREHTRTISSYMNSASAEESSRFNTLVSPIAQAANASTSTVLTPPYTPAVGKASEGTVLKQSLKAPTSASSDRPISHILHEPVEESSSMLKPLAPSRPASSGSAMASSRLDPFYLQAIERHRVLIEKEATAKTDEERLELYANFMVHESRLRRDRYTTAYNAMAGDIVDLMRDMWRSHTGQSKRAATPSTSMSSFEPAASSWASDGQPGSAHANMPSSASSFGEFTPGTEASLLDTPDSIGMERGDSRQWGEAFKPSLSPIPSMAVSTAQDDDSSRGRTASRWWEASNSGSGSIGKPERIEKTIRETKYMGISPSLFQEGGQYTPQTGSTAGPSDQIFRYGPDEYPPEKVGWHGGDDFDTPLVTPSRPRKASTPGANLLDVSRLVTLPPPYPRHYPALNNKHPLLADLRAEHRALTDNSEIQKIKDAYMDQDYAIQREQQNAAKERRTNLRTSIQAKVSDGTISFAEAAQAEADFDQEEAERGKANARSNFDVFEANVSHPLNTLITEKLQQADTCIAQLRAELDSRNEVSDPNQAQEEGDEQPERLEKLTLLKWLFEAREQLHKEMFDLHAERSAKYSEVILTPFRIAKLQSKIDDATAFFAKDERERQVSSAKDKSKRIEELQYVIEQNVSRGVEDQLSAFWDIAPGLLEVVQSVPDDVSQLDILIPDQEIAENPSYVEFPLQYLYSLLSHAERSAYQFIESQTNLLCLLHEVRTAAAKARLRLLELERSANISDSTESEALAEEMAEASRVEEGFLTRELKEKVGEVERQWREALGGVLGQCRGRVREWLEFGGGWEEGLEG